MQGMKSTLLTLFASLLPLTACVAQQTVVSNAHIATVTVRSTDNRYTLPIITLGSNDSIIVSFDELSHDYHRYTYSVEHCDAQWNTSDLTPIDYIDGFASDNNIEQFSQSLNTMTDYTHYTFSLPNEQISMRLSGNYRISVFDDDNRDTPVFTTCFRVVEQLFSISSKMSSDTDIDRNAAHQQLTFSIGTGSVNLRNPERELTVQVMQNKRTDNMVELRQPSFIGSTELRYEHCRNLIFEAGNEFRRFETVSIRQPGIGVNSLSYHAPFRHATLYTDEPRDLNYIYDQDQNGGFTIRYDKADDNDIEADYMFVHFALQCDEMKQGELFIAGDMTNYTFDETTRMKYNSATRCYETTLLLKQGAYNYEYLFRPSGKPSLTTAPAEGNHYETENVYTILIYYRPVGERYDRLAGAAE
jgi:hypothetical protein